MKKTILVTGGAGYIGSHSCVLLLEAGYRVVVVDNLCNSKSDSLSRVEELTGRAIQFHLADLRDASEMKRLFDREEIDAVVHFAGRQLEPDADHGTQDEVLPVPSHDALELERVGPEWRARRGRGE